MVKSLLGLVTLVCTVGCLPPPAFAQAAPGLTSISVTRVTSTAVPGGETISSNMFGTSRDHSGPWLKVETFDFGYSSYRAAKFGGRTMKETSSRPYPSRGPAIGFFRTWEIQTPYSSGLFSYEANSRTTGQRYFTNLNVR